MIRYARMLPVLIIVALVGACAATDIGPEYAEVSEEESALQFYGPGLAGGFRQFLSGQDSRFVHRTFATYGPKFGEFPFAQMYFVEAPPDKHFTRAPAADATFKNWDWFNNKTVKTGIRGETVNALGRVEFATASADGIACVAWLQTLGRRDDGGVGTMLLNGYYCRGEGPMLSEAEAEMIVKRIGHREYGAVAAPQGWGGSPDVAVQPSPGPTKPGSPKKPGDKGKKGGGTAAGTGFFVNMRGVIVTNAHVVEDCQSIDVRGFGPATVVAVDKGLDLAALELTRSGRYKFARLRVADTVRVGQDVVVFGYPLSSALSSTGNLTKGNISALAGVGNDTTRVQITAPIQPGNSGAPMFDSSGAVAGVIVSSINPAYTFERTGAIPQNVNFAIKGAFLKSFLQTYRIEFTQSTSDETIPTTDIADAAQDVSVYLVCRVSE